MSSRLACAVLGAALALSSSVALRADAQVPAREYASRRTAMVAGTLDSGIVLAYGGVEPVNYWPTFFSSCRTSSTSPDSARRTRCSCWSSATERWTSSMFVPTRSVAPTHGGWARARRRAHSRRKIGIAGRDIPPPSDSIRSWRPACRSSSCPTCNSRTMPPGLADARLASRLSAPRRAPGAARASLDSAVNALRAKKSPAEVVAAAERPRDQREGAHRGDEGRPAPGCGENEIQALLEGSFRRFGGDRPANAAS